MVRAGFPTTTWFSGTSPTTTAPSPMRLPAPTRTSGITDAPEPTYAARSMVTRPPITAAGATTTKSSRRESWPIVEFGPTEHVIADGDPWCHHRPGAHVAPDPNDRSVGHGGGRVDQRCPPLAGDAERSDDRLVAMMHRLVADRAHEHGLLESSPVGKAADDPVAVDDRLVGHVVVEQTSDLDRDPIALRPKHEIGDVGNSSSGSEDDQLGVRRSRDRTYSAVSSAPATNP